LKPVRFEGKKLQAAVKEMILLLNTMVKGSNTASQYFILHDGACNIARILSSNCHIPDLQAACTELLASAMATGPKVIMQLSEASAVTGIVRQVFTASSRGNQDQLLSALNFVRAMAKNASESSPSEKDLIINAMLESGLVEKLVNMLISCPTSIPDPDKVNMNSALCLFSMLQFDIVQDLMSMIKGSYSALFSVFRMKSDELLVQFLISLMAMLAQPTIADVCVTNGLIVELPTVIIHQNMIVQSNALKIIVSLLKSLTNKTALRNQTLLSSLQRISGSSPAEAVRSTATKLLAIINSL